MLAIFHKAFANPPEELKSPASEKGPKKPKLPQQTLNDFVSFNPNNTFHMSFGHAAVLAFVRPFSPSSLHQMLFCGYDDIYCLFKGSLDNLCGLIKDYGLSKSANEAMLVIEAYRTLRDRGPYPADQVIKNLEGRFGFVIYDSKTGTVFTALGADGGVKLYWGIAGDGSVVISDDLDLIKAGCAHSFAPFPPDTDGDGGDENVIQNTNEDINCRANFSIEEDVALISSYMRVSEDATVGTRQKIDKMWARVKEQYDLARIANPSLRPRKEGMLDNRFRRMSSIVMKWAGCYQQASRRRASGWNEEQVVTEALSLYEPGKFNLFHAWKMMKGYRKWMITIAPYATPASKVGVVIESSSDVDTNSSGKRVRLEDDNYSSPISIESHSASIQRPEGIKAAKRNKGKKKVNAEYEEMNQNFQRMKQLSNRDQDLEREKLEIKKKNAEIALQQLELKNKREERKRKDQELEQKKNDWDMLQNLLQTPSLPPQLEKMKFDLLEKFGDSYSIAREDS